MHVVEGMMLLNLHHDKHHHFKKNQFDFLNKEVHNFELFKFSFYEIWNDVFSFIFSFSRKIFSL